MLDVVIISVSCITNIVIIFETVNYRDDFCKKKSGVSLRRSKITKNKPNKQNGGNPFVSQKSQKPMKNRIRRQI